MTEINKIRKEIDKIDKKILDLIDERFKLSLKVGNLKMIQQIKISQPIRELEIIEKLKKIPSVVKPKYIESIWKEIISASKEIQQLDMG
ncbi:MAG: chorismate mutase [Promethearchaeota archaeon]